VKKAQPTVMKKPLLILIVIAVVLFIIKQKNMTWRQSFLKTMYPIIMLKGKWFPGKHDVVLNSNNKVPPVSFYSLKAIANTGDTIDFNQFKGKKVLIVNTASNCGFTAQYDALEKLYQQNSGKLVMLAFPANDFKQQEQSDDKDIAAFCKINYGISFPIMHKSQVVKGPEQNMVYQWLTEPEQNGWCSQAPLWNFGKYVIDENGVLTGFFSQNISPLGKELKNVIAN
jgi:glutathione peroxidase